MHRTSTGDAEKEWGPSLRRVDTTDGFVLDFLPGIIASGKAIFFRLCLTFYCVGILVNVWILISIVAQVSNANWVAKIMQPSVYPPLELTLVAGRASAITFQIDVLFLDYYNCS